MDGAVIRGMNSAAGGVGRPSKSPLSCGWAVAAAIQGVVFPRGLTDQIRLAPQRPPEMECFHQASRGAEWPSPGKLRCGRLEDKAGCKGHLIVDAIYWNRPVKSQRRPRRVNRRQIVWGLPPYPASPFEIVSGYGGKALVSPAVLPACLLCCP